MRTDGGDPLSKLAFKYLTDKCPQIKHPFTPFYFDLLKDKRNTIKKVLEIGIGNVEQTLKWRPSREAASLLMWQDFFPNADIFGIDILSKSLFQKKRIHTFLCDQTNEKQLRDLIIKIGADIDLIIDDGSHKTRDQILTCQILMPIVKKSVIYIIEDVREPEKVAAGLNMYHCVIPNLRRKFKDDNVVVVTNKH